MTFEKGKSGNPDGRPKGIKDKRVMFREIVEEHKKDLIEKAIEMAFDGNEQMLRLLLSRLLPACPKNNPLPNIGNLGNTVENRCKKIRSLVLDGTITPEEGNYLLQLLKHELEIQKTNRVFIPSFDMFKQL